MHRELGELDNPRSVVGIIHFSKLIFYDELTTGVIDIPNYDASFSTRSVSKHLKCIGILW